MSRKVMRLIDASTGQMECRVCGAEHVANIRPGSGGNYYRGSWCCTNGCRLPPSAEGPRAPHRAECRRRTAFHEAGHAVLILASRSRLDDVRIDLDVRRDGAVGMVRGGGPAEWASLQRELLRRATDTRAFALQAMSVLTCVRFSLAGLVAEVEAHGEWAEWRDWGVSQGVTGLDVVQGTWLIGSGEDFESAARGLEVLLGADGPALGGDGRQHASLSRDRLGEALRAEVEHVHGLLLRCWPAVERLASALMERQTLDGEEAEEVVGDLGRREYRATFEPLRWFVLTLRRRHALRKRAWGEDDSRPSDSCR